MARFTQYADGTVIDTTTGHKVGCVIAPQGVKGINGPAFYRLDQIKGGTLLKPEQAAKGVVLARRDFDEVVTDGRSRQV